MRRRVRVGDTNLGSRSMRGSYRATNNDELVCFDDSPGIAANRFMTDEYVS
jgi:hypothetical protein